MTRSPPSSRESLTEPSSASQNKVLRASTIVSANELPIVSPALFPSTPPIRVKRAQQTIMNQSKSTRPIPAQRPEIEAQRQVINQSHIRHHVHHYSQRQV